MLITISGLPGSGTSTVGTKVAAELGLDHLDGGTVFRSVAAERGLSLAAFAALAESDRTIDVALDDRLTDRAREGEVVLESRLAGWLATRAGLDAVRIWITCDEVERARRVAQRDGGDADTALDENRVREASERARYQAFYDIDLTDLSIYDHLVDSATMTPGELVAEIVTLARRAPTG